MVYDILFHVVYFL